ncbi:MAG: site-specific DNA-methyltransferase, partial [Acetobacteraceae bacterium]|nr:site-specific DNA-methyltransferase [Acetobacteraceae bacterium]
VEEWCERAQPRRPATRPVAPPEAATVTLLVGDALRVLRRLPDRRFQCCVTSPPYWRQRDYRTPGQIGWERTPEPYAAKLVAVLREVRRTLRDDVLLFVNIGDAYGGRSRRRGGTGHPSTGTGDNTRTARATRTPALHGGIKDKELLLIPHRFALAAQADGWLLRSDIIWHKTACLPESVRDRPTGAHEHVFMLAKRPDYFWDAKAIAEPASPASAARYGYPFGNARPGRGRTAVNGTRAADGTRNARDVWSIPAAGGAGGAHPAMMPRELAERCLRAASRPGDEVLDPFGGAGTTALAAAGLGRLATLIELSPECAALARERLGALLR